MGSSSLLVLGLKVKVVLTVEFESKGLKKLKYFLGIEMVLGWCSIKRNTLKMLEEIEKLRCRSIVILIETNHQIIIKDGKLLGEKPKSDINV